MGRERRKRPDVVVAVAAGVGLFTGLLANGGGFLLVPAYLLVLGLSMRMAAGTSLVVAAALTIPTLITHWALWVTSIGRPRSRSRSEVSRGRSS